MVRDLHEVRHPERSRWTWSECGLLTFYLLITCLITEILIFYNQAAHGWKSIFLVVTCWVVVGISSRNPSHIMFISFFTAIFGEYSWWTTYSVRKVNMLLGRLPDTVILINMTGESFAGSKMPNGSFHVAGIRLADIGHPEKITRFVEDHQTMLDRYRGYYGTSYTAMLNAILKHVYRPRLPDFVFHVSYDVASPLLMLSVPTVLFCITLLHLRRKAILALRIADLTVALQEFETDSGTHRIKLDANENITLKRQSTRQLYNVQLKAAVENNASIEIVQVLVEQLKNIDQQISSLTQEKNCLQDMLLDLTEQIRSLQDELADARARN